MSPRVVMYTDAMPVQVIRFDETPNPNALKCVLDGQVSDRPRSFRTPEEASTDPLAGALFSIRGVNNVLINGDWITIGKTPDADWKSVKSGVEKTLSDHTS